MFDTGQNLQVVSAWHAELVVSAEHTLCTLQISFFALQVCSMLQYLHVRSLAHVTIVPLQVPCVAQVANFCVQV